MSFEDKQKQMTGTAPVGSPVELLEKRAKVFDEIKQLRDKYHETGKEWTEADNKTWKSRNDDYDELTAEIDAATQAAQAARETGDGMTFRRGQSVADAFRRSFDYTSEQRDYDRIGLGNYCRAMVCGPKNDIERRALSEGTDSAGGYTVPVILANQLIDAMVAQSQVMNAGAEIVQLSSDVHDFARLATEPTPAWRAENAAVSESDPTFDRVRFQPKSCAFQSKASRELLEDSVNLGTELPRIFGRTMANEIDRVALLGSGSGNEPTGLSGITINSVDKSASALTDFSDIVSAMQLIQEDNGETGDAMLMAPRTFAELANLADTTGQPLMPPAPVAALRRLVTSKIPTNEGTGTNESTIYLGDWSQVRVGLRSDVRIEVLRERYADNLQYGFLVWMRLDVQCFQPNGLAKVEGIIPPA